MTDEFQEWARRLHALGTLPLSHFLKEIAAGRDVRETLRRYTALDPQIIFALGADSIDASATAAEAELIYLLHGIKPP
jgi:hypothetical protein